MQERVLLAVENRVVILVGATTENPFFEVNSALISRSRIVELHTLSDADIAHVTHVRDVETARAPYARDRAALLVDRDERGQAHGVFSGS